MLLSAPMTLATAVRQWGKGLSEAVHEQGLATRVVESIGKLVGADAAFFALFNADRSIRVQADAGIPPWFLPHLNAHGLSRPGSDSVCATALSDGVAVPRARVYSEQRWRAHPLYEAAAPMGLLDYMAAPLVGLEGPAGLLVVARHVSRRSFDEVDARLAQSAVTHAAILLPQWQRERQHRLEQLPQTARDQRLIGLVAEGRRNHEIAQVLCVSPNTVKDALKRLFRRYGVHTRTQLSRLAR